MESAARGRVRASSAIVSPVVTFQLMVGGRSLIGPSDRDVFKGFLGLAFLTLKLLRYIKSTTLDCLQSWAGCRGKLLILSATVNHHQ